MQMSPAGVIALARFEAVVLSAYKDSVGVMTIGVGHTAAAGIPKPVSGMSFSAREAIDLLRSDLVTYEAAVTRNVKVALAQHEFDALVSFTFNLGEGNLKSSTLLRKLNAGDRAGAAAAFGSWVKAGGKTLQGLVTRRAAERAIFERADYGDVSTVPVFDRYPGKARLVPAADLFASEPAPKPADPAETTDVRGPLIAALLGRIDTMQADLNKLHADVVALSEGA